MQLKNRKQTLSVTKKGKMKMITKKIIMNEVDSVKDFVRITNKYPFNVLLAMSHYVVDGKSLLGVFSLDFSRPIELRIEADDNSVTDYLNEIREYICD